MQKKLILKKDEYVFKQGEVATEFFLIVSGTFRVTKFENQVEHVKRGRLTMGDIFGELSLFDGKRREFNVIAEQDSELHVIPYSHIMQHSAEVPPWAMALIKTMADHIRRLLVYAKDDEGNFQI